MRSAFFFLTLAVAILTGEANQQVSDRGAFNWFDHSQTYMLNSRGIVSLLRLTRRIVEDSVVNFKMTNKKMTYPRKRRKQT